MNNEELLMYILDGLGLEYDTVVANLTFRSGDVSLQEAQFLLHKHEMRLEKQHSAYIGFHKASIFLANKQFANPQPNSSMKTMIEQQSNQTIPSF